MTTRDSPVIGIGMVGHGFMGSVHSRALRAIGSTARLSGATPRLVSISGRNPASLEATRSQYGWMQAFTDWREQIVDPNVTVVDNVSPPPLHFEPTLKAIELGKHVFCEKPLAQDARQAHALWCAAAKAGVVHACGFNYRFFPALAVARSLIAAGELGEILHFHSRFYVPTTPTRDQGSASPAGSYSGDVTRSVASHHIDAARFLVGEVCSVFAHAQGVSADFEPGDGQDRAVHAILAFKDGASGTTSAAFLDSCPAVDSLIEVVGTRSGLRFSLRDLNVLTLASRSREQTIYCNDPVDPFMRHWYPFGHPLGWDDSFTNQFDSVIRAISDETRSARDFATFEDGYRCAEICDAMLESARTNQCIHVEYLPLA